MDAADSERFARLEREVTDLRQEVERLRSQLEPPAPALPRAASSIEPEPPRPAAPIATVARQPGPVPGRLAAKPPVRVPRRTSVEELVGRYGTIVVAAVTLLVGIGVFLSWAIAHGLLGPTMRVVLGYVAAAVVAGVGASLRRRGARPFGNVLLALALCVVHLVCWSAGPLLHVMPSFAALAIGFGASAVLALFALRHDEQTLCALGFGGAAIAPFVTSESSGNVIALALYGAGVIALSAAALGDRAWRAALGVTIGAVLLYLAALHAVRPTHTAWPWILARLEVLFPVGLLPAILLLAKGRQRRVLLRAVTAALILGALLRTPTGTDLWTLGLTSAGTILAIGALDRLRPRTVGAVAAGSGIASPDFPALIDALILPLGLFAAALAAVQPLRSITTALVATAWALCAGAMTYRTRAELETELHAWTATLTALVIAPAASPVHERSRVVGLALVGLVLGFTALRLPRLAFEMGAATAAALASAWAVVLLRDRPDFAYPPFLTPESAVSLAVIAAWSVLWRFGREQHRLTPAGAALRSTLRHVLALGAPLTAFLWVRAELAGAWSVTASTALLVVFYAATGTFTIWLGRRLGPKELRTAGLALTLWAAGKTLVEATDVASVALRIGLYLAVSAFLIAVAYWYRKGGSPPAATTPEVPRRVAADAASDAS